MFCHASSCLLGYISETLRCCVKHLEGASARMPTVFPAETAGMVRWRLVSPPYVMGLLPPRIRVQGNPHTRTQRGSGGHSVPLRGPTAAPRGAVGAAQRALAVGQADNVAGPTGGRVRPRRPRRCPPPRSAPRSGPRSAAAHPSACGGPSQGGGARRRCTVAKCEAVELSHRFPRDHFPFSSKIIVPGVRVGHNFSHEMVPNQVAHAPL